jgi:hypothetical protein
MFLCSFNLESFDFLTFRLLFLKVKALLAPVILYWSETVGENIDKTGESLDRRRNK